MKLRWNCYLLALAAISILSSGQAIAQDFRMPGYGDYSGYALLPSDSIYLARNDTDMPTHSSGTTIEEPFRESWFTANKIHGYLGLSSLILAGVAAATAPDDDEGAPATPVNKGTHHNAATAAAALGAAAVTSGFLLHWDDVNPENGLLDRDNLHMLLGVLATAGFIAAVSQAPQESHATLGMAGGVAMGIGIVLEW